MTCHNVSDMSFSHANLVSDPDYDTCSLMSQPLCYKLISQMDDYLFKNLVSIIDMDFKEANIGYLLWFKFKQQHKYCFERVDQYLRVRVFSYLISGQ